MANTQNINIGVLVTGNTRQVANDTKEIRDNLNDATRSSSTITSNLSQRVASRIGGGTFGGGGDLPAGLGRGTAAGNIRGDSRDFARQAQGLGGLVHLYATFAANVFAVSTAFNALSKAMDVTRMEKALGILSQRSGQSLKNLAKDMYSISDGAISMVDSMRFASMGSAANIASKDMKQLATIAKGASIALGRDMNDALDRLTRGVTKLEPELIDELGILTKAQEAYKKYATQLGLSVDDMSSAQKSQAYLNAVLEEGTRKWASLANEMGANPYQRLLSGLKDVGTKILQTVNSVLGPIVELISKSESLIFALIVGITAKLATMAIPTLTAGRNKYLKEVSDLVTEQNSLRNNQEKILNASVLAQQKELLQKMAVERGNFEKSQLSSVQGLYSKTGAKAFDEKISGATNLRTLTKDKELMTHLRDREKAIQEKLDRQDLELSTKKRMVKDQEINLSDKQLASLEKQRAASILQLQAAKDMNKVLSDQSQIVTKLQADHDALNSKKRVVVPGREALVNEQKLAGANAKDKFMSGEHGVGGMFTGLVASMNAMDALDGKTSKLTTGMNTFKAAATSAFLFVEKGAMRFLGILMGPVGIIGTMLVAAWDPLMRLLGASNRFTDSVESGSDRVKEAVDKSGEAYVRMKNILNESGQTAEQWNNNLLKFNVATTTQLSESLTEIKSQIENVAALRADAANGDFFGSKTRLANKAESDVKSSAIKSVDAFGVNASGDSAKQYLNRIKEITGQSLNSFDEVKAKISSLSGESLGKFVDVLTKAGTDVKGFAVGMEAAVSSAANVTKTFDADLAKFEQKKNFDHIAAPFRSIIESVDNLDEKIKKLASKGVLSTAEATSYNTALKERAEIIERMLSNETYRAKLSKEDLAVLQGIVNTQKTSERLAKIEFDTRNKISKLISVDLKQFTDIGTLQETTYFSNMSKAVEDVSTNVLQLTSILRDNMSVMSNPEASNRMKLNSIRAIESVIKAYSEQAKVLAAMKRLEVAGGTEEQKLAVNSQIDVLSGIIDKFSRAGTESGKSFYEGLYKAWEKSGSKLSFKEFQDRQADSLDAMKSAASVLGKPLKDPGKAGEADQARLTALKARLELEKEHENLAKDSFDLAKQRGIFDLASLSLIEKYKNMQSATQREIKGVVAEQEKNKSKHDELIALANGELAVSKERNALAIEELRREELAIALKQKRVALAEEEAKIATLKAAGFTTGRSSELSKSLVGVETFADAQTGADYEIATTRAGQEYSDAREKLKEPKSNQSEHELQLQSEILEIQASLLDIEQRRLENQIVSVQLAYEKRIAEEKDVSKKAALEKARDGAVGGARSAIAQNQALSSSVRKLAKDYSDMAKSKERATKFDKDTKSIKNLSGSLKSFGAILDEVFEGKGLKKFGDGLSSIMELMSENRDQTAEGLKLREEEQNAFSRYNEANTQYIKDSLNGTEEQQAASLKALKESESAHKQSVDNRMAMDEASFSANMGQYASLAGIVGGFFDKGSKEAKAFHTLQMTLMAIKLAMELKTAAASVGASASVVAGKTSEATANAAASVTAAGSGDPYTGIARVAIMMGLMVAALSAFGVKSGKGSLAASAPSIPTIDGTGTTFGDPTAKSESLSKSIDLWSDDLLKQTKQGNEMIFLLTSIDKGINATARSLISTGVTSGRLSKDSGLVLQAELVEKPGETFRNQSDDFLARMDKIDGGMGGGFLGFEISNNLNTLGRAMDFIKGTKKVEQSIVAAGLEVSGTIGAAVARQFATVFTTTTTKRYGKTKQTDSAADYYDNNEAASNLVTSVFSRLGRSIVLGVELLGFKTEAAAADFATKVSNLDLGTFRIGMLGATGTALTEALQTALSAKSDTLVEQALSLIGSGSGNFTSLADEMKDLRINGEGLYETFQRVTSEVLKSNTVLKTLAVTFDPKGWLYLSNFDAENVGGALVKNALGDRLYEVNESLGGIFETVTGSIDELVSLYKDLIDINHQMRSMNLSGGISYDTVEGAGSYEAIKDGLETLMEDAGAAAAVNYAQFGLAEIRRRLTMQSASGGSYLNASIGTPSGMATVPDTLPGIRDRIKLLETERDTLDASTEVGANRIKDIDYEIGVNLSAATAVETLTEATKDYVDQLMKMGDAMRDFFETVNDIVADNFKAYGLESSLSDPVRDFTSATKSLTDSFSGVVDELVKNFAGEEFTSRVEALKPVLKSAFSIISDTLVQSVRASIVETRIQLSELSGSSSGLQSELDLSAMPALEKVSEKLIGLFGNSVNVLQTPIEDFGTWAQTTAQNIAGQLAIGEISAQDAEEALSIVGTAQEAKFKVISVLKDIFDFHLSAAESAYSNIEKIRNTISSNRRKIAENRDLIAGNNSTTNVAAYLDQEISRVSSAYSLAVATNDIEEAMSLYDEYSGLVSERYDTEITRIQEVIDLQTEYYDGLKQFLLDVNSYLDDLLLSDNSLLTPSQKVAEALTQFNDKLAIATAAPGGAYTNEQIAEAQSGFTGNADALLQAARDYGASGATYQDIYGYVTQQLQAVTGMSSVAQDPQVVMNALLQSQIDALDLMNVELSSLESSITDDLTNSLQALTTVMSQLATQGFPVDNLIQSLNSSLPAAISSALGFTVGTQTTAGAGAFLTPDRYAMYVNSYTDLLSTFENTIQGLQIGSDAFNSLLGPDLATIAAGYDADASGYLDKSEYGKAHYELVGAAEARVLPTVSTGTPTSGAAAGSFSPDGTIVSASAPIGSAPALSVGGGVNIMSTLQTFAALSQQTAVEMHYLRQDVQQVAMAINASSYNIVSGVNSGSLQAANVVVTGVSTSITGLKGSLNTNLQTAVAPRPTNTPTTYNTTGGYSWNPISGTFGAPMSISGSTAGSSVGYSSGISNVGTGSSWYSSNFR